MRISIAEVGDRDIQPSLYIVYLELRLSLQPLSSSYSARRGDRSIATP